MIKLRPIMNDHAVRKFACGRKMGNNEFSWSGIKGALYQIDLLHTSPKEFISKLIAVMSWLDAVVTYINVLHPMEN